MSRTTVATEGNAILSDATDEGSLAVPGRTRRAGGPRLRPPRSARFEDDSAAASGRRSDESRPDDEHRGAGPARRRDALPASRRHRRRAAARARAGDVLDDVAGRADVR